MTANAGRFKQRMNVFLERDALFGGGRRKLADINFGRKSRGSSGDSRDEKGGHVSHMSDLKCNSGSLAGKTIEESGRLQVFFPQASGGEH